jgi:hypothetical protein
MTQNLLTAKSGLGYVMLEVPESDVVRRHEVEKVTSANSGVLTNKDSTLTPRDL